MPSQQPDDRSYTKKGKEDKIDQRAESNNIRKYAQWQAYEQASKNHENGKNNTLRPETVDAIGKNQLQHSKAAPHNREHSQYTNPPNKKKEKGPPAHIHQTHNPGVDGH